MAIVGWRIWYADKSMVTSAQLPWTLAPATGVQIIAFYSDRQRPYASVVGSSTVEAYVDYVHGTDPRWGTADVYWYDPVTGDYGAGALAPVGFAVLNQKTGTVVTDDVWRTLWDAVRATPRVPP